MTTHSQRMQQLRDEIEAQAMREVNEPGVTAKEWQREWSETMRRIAAYAAMKPKP